MIVSRASSKLRTVAARIGYGCYMILSHAVAEKNVSVLDSVERARHKRYRYTTSASDSSIVANRRMTDATLQHIAPAAKRVLDAGCGDGTYASDIKRERSSLEIVGFDPASEAVRVARSRYLDIAFVVGDVLRSERFPEGEFDLITLRGVLPHVLDPAEAFRQLCHSCGFVVDHRAQCQQPILKLIENCHPTIVSARSGLFHRACWLAGGARHVALRRRFPSSALCRSSSHVTREDHPFFHPFFGTSAAAVPILRRAGGYRGEVEKLMISRAWPRFH
jgi:SAM-dependent methyltransferase